jgi:hypothetical protein
MIRTRITAAVLVLLVLLVAVTGCTSGAPTSTTETEGNATVESELTWQDAKAKAQAMELEIARMIPEDKVAKIEQPETGLLFSCSEKQHTWDGSTNVTLTEGTEEEPLLKAIEAHYQDGPFALESDLDIVGDYRVQLRSRDSAESYIFGIGEPGTIHIASGSACFTLPDGVYPGDEF